MQPDPNGSLQRIGPLARLPSLLAELGVDSAEVYGGLGVDPHALVADTRLPFSVALKIVERASRVAKRPDLGLLIGARADHRDLGMVGELMDLAPTLGRALADYVSVQGGLSRAASAFLVTMGETAALGYGIYHRHAPGTEHAYAIAVAVAVNAVRRLSGGQGEPIEVHLSHRAPQNIGPYERVLKARVRFNQEQTAVLFPREALDAINPRADPSRRAALSRALAAELRLQDATMSQRLRHLLRPALSIGDPTLASAARRLGLSVRSLNRRLAEEGTTFGRERDATRFVMACELLALTDLSVGDISFALAYANHSAFVRSFRRWSNAAPTEWRQAHLQANSHLQDTPTR
jgi:AraC-like DNA-binding protein